MSGKDNKKISDYDLGYKHGVRRTVIVMSIAAIFGSFAYEVVTDIVGESEALNPKGQTEQCDTAKVSTDLKLSNG